MWAKFLDKNVVEVNMLAFAKQLPDVLVAEGREGGNLEFEEMVLRGIKIDGMDTAAILQAKGEDVVPCRADSKYYVVLSWLQQSHICNVIFPGKGVDIRVVEASVLGK
jgi:hypothetical protein